jgi:uncharacterized circularly permuted ATP-grasp superfamily protein
MSAINPAENEFVCSEPKLLESYQPSPNAYDELTGGGGQVRPRWQRVLESFAAMGGNATQGAQQKAQRLMVENDVTFAALGVANRQWRLDLFPLLIEPDEWSAIERGVVQRTLLLNRLLADLYGAQRVLKDRLLPAGLVYGSTQFLRPCTSIAVRDDLHLNFVAFDLTRSADGRWWVVSDRTQAPAGAGYALETASCPRSACRSCSRRATCAVSRAFSARSRSAS